MSDLEDAVDILEDCILAGDNAEVALATTAVDCDVNGKDLAEAFKKRFGKDHQQYEADHG